MHCTLLLNLKSYTHIHTLTLTHIQTYKHMYAKAQQGKMRQPKIVRRSGCCFSFILYAFSLLSTYNTSTKISPTQMQQQVTPDTFNANANAAATIANATLANTTTRYQIAIV